MRVGVFTAPRSRNHVRALAAAFVVSLAGAGFSAHAGLTLGTKGSSGAGGEYPSALDQVVGAGSPDAAVIHAQTARTPLASPAGMRGVTGTIELPASAVPDTADASIRPAQPFVLRGTEQDRVRALQCLTTAIYYEAASEPDDGQAAVAQVILNRVRHPTFPATVCGVIYQGSEKAGCQFSYACDGSMARAPQRSAWERARRSAARALAGYVYAPVGLATHYHTYAVRPAWNRTLVMTDFVGAHFFHRWKGWWGTAAAFSQNYYGGEPLPGPSRPATVSPGEPAQAAAIATATKALLQITATQAIQPAADIQPQHVESGAPLSRYAAVETADSQILDRWKDSGKPLR